MGQTLVLGPDDYARVRFATSPLWETASALRVLIEPRRHGYHLPWLDTVRPEVERMDLRTLPGLMPRHGWTPDFLTPAPTGPDTDVADQLARVRSAPVDLVAAEVTRSVAGRSGVDEARRLADDPAAARHLLADLLAESWRVMVEPHWPRLRDLLRADVAYRTRVLADHGLGRVLDDLHPRARWTGRAVVVDNADDEVRTLDGRGLLLMPSVFVWPSLTVVADTPAPPVLVYPARGIAELWQPARTARSASLARLLGRTRASLLESLEEPASTHTLARRHDLAPSTVSEHLTVLREAGLVVRRRDRHSVMYERTALGFALSS